MAIGLITIAALIVILGTFLEAYTDSHLYAAQWTYHHPFFAFLLSLFFINILFSALRRWPFKMKHIPFLITHLGLLMIISGTLIKNKYGIQGNLMLLEGSSNQHLLIPHTYALLIEKKDSLQTLSYPIQLAIDHSYLQQDSSLPELKWKVKHYVPHVIETLETWIKGNRAFISGFPSIPVQNWKHGDPLLVQSEVQIHPQQSTLWDLIAIRTDNIEEAIKQAYLQGMKIKLSSKNNDQSSLVFSLIDVIDNSVLLQNQNIHLSLHLPYSLMEGFTNPFLALSTQQETTQFNLKGEKALYSLVERPSWKYSSDFYIDLERKPLILLLEDLEGNGVFCAFDSHGRVYAQSFRPANLNNLVIYDQGFAGYAAQLSFPFPAVSPNRKEKESLHFQYLNKQLQTAIAADPNLIPPLFLLKDACKRAKSDLATTFLEFLFTWYQNGSPLCNETDFLNSNLKNVFQYMDWTVVPAQDKQACNWIVKLINQLEIPLKSGENLIDFLEKNKWPFLSDLHQQQKEEHFDIFKTLAQQIFSVTHQLPINEETHLSIDDQARLFSAYLIAYGIHYQTLLDSLLQKEEEEFEDYTPLVLETPLTLKHRIEKPSYKLEDNRAWIKLEINKGHHKQLIKLAYDAIGTGLKWPILNGDYTIRFQPQLVKIPYRLRLRQARQINYANSNQPYSYESDILISTPNQPSIEKTLSMNRVYETWDGYRFYLAGMSTTDSGIKRVQIIVNYDPAKYYLTYPGALVISLGIILLFWMWPYSYKKYP